MAKFTVVIPYYQKQHGVLGRALASVFSQTLQDFDLVIVDDESPYPIEKEIAELSADQQARIKVVKQANAGPGGARNTGLDHVPAETTYVAFLDSDDMWTPDHLKNAAFSLDTFGGECYWASMQASDEFYYHFAISELENDEGAVRLSESPKIIELPNLATVMLRNWSFLHLSCMVIGRPLFETIRFDPVLRLAAEDVLFFCDCILASKRTLLCDDAGAMRGMGVNIFHSIDNTSPEFLRQQFNTWVALDTLQSRFAKRPADVASIASYKNTARKQALWSQAGKLKQRQAPELGLLFKWMMRDPAILRAALELGTGKFARPK
ncbi:glycosyltransferase family 2 protein [Agrobacterium rubi]|uniref:Glycosyltransferase family 2 protein n=2 Tax=Agrobacterium rubi TaxID=28099 RepID=A0AAE7R7F1_9HYPH|nr:glycosyltransferase family A protein [Agrobacterium rubi]MBP1878788.1 succinoglycan biosynthesis protein ExoW [Agrobacterium rubi]MCL6652853.1 succinoglycan biosynthesis protein exow [Agrobacterium rubi]NTE88591.1 glycosyltransferase family 2 protein [Agrobacterium rubi]NTF04419.1 glycosyltransferase family 2 protein [Agrobacterium rubi]NTF09952.1 glycosyltransferase family 2 protein [Agrobacterium rubi]